MIASLQFRRAAACRRQMFQKLRYPTDADGLSPKALERPAVLLSLAGRHEAF